MSVLIVSKTKMHHNECVGGIDLDNGRYLRLLTANGHNQPRGCNYEIGEVWNLQYWNRNPVTAPHLEDVLVRSARYSGNRYPRWSLGDFFKRQLRNGIWRGGPNTLYDGHLRFTRNGSGYISHHSGVPSQSVGFWLSDEDLHLEENWGKQKYHYSDGYREARITFVGLEDPIEVIPAGTVIRVSLARWWSPWDSDVEDRCYLQLSGWYS